MPVQLGTLVDIIIHSELVDDHIDTTSEPAFVKSLKHLIEDPTHRALVMRSMAALRPATKQLRAATLGGDGDTE